MVLESQELAGLMGVVGLTLSYTVLQVVAIRRYEGWARSAAFLPLIGMVGFALVLLASGANLWPLSLLLGAILGAFYLAVLALIRRLTQGAWFGAAPGKK